MSPNPESFLSHLQTEGYHPRSDKHSNALARAIVVDLIANCAHIQKKAAAGELVFDLNFPLLAGTAEWNVDLVFGPPQLGISAPPTTESIVQHRPSRVEIAIEIKSVMTEHRKAIKNRKRDLEAHHEHVHNYDDQAIAGGVIVINASDTFKSPLRPASTAHKNATKLVEHCIAELRSVSHRGGVKGYGLEARCAIVVSVDNVNHLSGKYVNDIPPVGDPLQYDAFVRAICESYSRRF